MFIIRYKVSLPLHYAGMNVLDIFEDLQDLGPIPDSGDNAYRISICKLDSYFQVDLHKRRGGPLTPGLATKTSTTLQFQGEFE